MESGTLDGDTTATVSPAFSAEGINNWATAPCHKADNSNGSTHLIIIFPFISMSFHGLKAQNYKEFLNAANLKGIKPPISVAGVILACLTPL
jgi:hypothetical protein